MSLSLFDERLESYLIGSCIVGNPTEKTKILSAVSEEDFYYKHFRRLFGIMLKLVKANKEIDLISVNEKFDNITFLDEVAMSVVTTANIEQNIRNIKEMSIKRKYVDACSKVIEMANSNEYFDYIDFKNDALKELNIEDNVETESFKLKDLFSDYLENLENESKVDERSIIKTGFNWIDKYAGGLGRGVTCVGARPSIGKSAFVVNVIKNLMYQDKKVVFFNLEMGSDEIIHRLMATDTYIPMDKLLHAHNLEEDDWTKIAKSYNGMLKHADNIHLVTKMQTLEQIRNYCRELKLKGQLDVVFIDYLQLMTSTQKHNGRTELITNISRDLKLLQLELNVPFWILVQMNRNAAGKVPELHEIKDSGGIEQDADRVFLLHDAQVGEQQDIDDKTVSELMLIVAKNRHGRRDIVGNLKYYKNTQSMFDR